MDLQTIRQQFPQYSDMSDRDLTLAFHKRYYPDIDIQDFAQQIGYQPQYDTSDIAPGVLDAARQVLAPKPEPEPAPTTWAGVQGRRLRGIGRDIGQAVTSFPRNVVSAFMQTGESLLASAEQQLPGAAHFLGQPALLDLGDVAAEAAEKVESARGKVEAPLPETSYRETPISAFSQALTSGGVSLGTGLAAAAVTGNPTVALAVLGEMERASTYKGQIEAGASEEKAALIADISGAAEVIGESLVFPKIFRGMKGNVSISEGLDLIYQNAGQEGVTGYIQAFVDTAGRLTSQGMDRKEAFKRAAVESVGPALESAGVGGVLGGGPLAVSALTPGHAALDIRPSYEQLLERATQSDQAAVDAIQAEDYQGSPTEVVSGALPSDAAPSGDTRPVQDQPELTDVPDEITPDMVTDQIQEAPREGDQLLMEFMRKTKKEKRPTEASTLTSYLESKSKVDPVPVDQLNETVFGRAKRRVREKGSSFLISTDRIQQLLPMLDGYVRNGPLKTAIWDRVRNATTQRQEAIFEQQRRFKDALQKVGVDFKSWMSKVQKVSDTLSLTKAQQIGVAMLSQNPNGMRYLRKGMNISRQDLRAVQNIVAQDPARARAMNWMQRAFQVQWERLYDAAIKAGVNPDVLQQEKNYFPLMLLDPSVAGKQGDFLDMLVDRFQGRPMPNKGVIRQRRIGAKGRIELDAFTTFMNNIGRAESFIAMAPVAKKVGAITGSQGFRQAFNDATHKRGIDVLDKWLEHSVRGQQGDPVRGFEKLVKYFRVNTKQYLLQFKVLSGLRQFTSFTHGLMSHPKVALEALRVFKDIPPGNWRAYQNLKADVESKSLVVKNRTWDRDIRRTWDPKTAKKFLSRSRRIAPGVWLHNAIDKFTVVVVWEANYRHAKNNLEMNEDQARLFADDQVIKTQPVADPETVPDLWRQGEVAKAFTDFQQMPNQTWNILRHDVLGATRAGQISKPMAAYRIMMTTVFPSILLGAIARGRPQDDPEELLEDLSMYGIVGNIPVAGPWLARAYAGWTASQGLAKVPLEEAVKTAKELMKGEKINKRRAIIHGAKAVGAATGKLPHQAILTAEGLYDLSTGETHDPRRLLWSEYQLRNESDKPRRQR